MDTADALKIALQAVALLGAALAGYVAMRVQLAGAQAAAAEAKSTAGEALRAAKAVHSRVDDHERRLTGAERDVAHHGRNLEQALSRLEAQVSALNARLDRLLASRAQE